MKTKAELLQELINKKNSVPGLNEVLKHLVIAKGEKGDKGDTVVGPQGPCGFQGESIVGPQGPKGDKGDSPSSTDLRKIIIPLIPEPIPGLQGPQGIPGNDATLPELNKLVSLAKEELKKEPIHIKDIKGTEKLIEFLKLGGFRGGGGGGGSVSPLTTKGDLYTYSTVNARLAVGTNGQILSADSTQATGLKWIAAPASTLAGISAASLTTPNSLYTMTSTIPVEFKTSGGISALKITESTGGVTMGATLGVTGITTLSANVTLNGSAAEMLSLKGTGSSSNYIGIYNNGAVLKSLFGVAINNDALITGAVSGDVAWRSVNTNMLFSVDNGTTANMYIKASNGNVGIGTTSPGYKLDVGNGSANGNGTSTVFLNVSNGILFTSNVKSATRTNLWAMDAFGTNFPIFYSTGTSPSILAISGTNSPTTTPTAANNVMSWNVDNFRVGIGTEAPAFILDVLGKGTAVASVAAQFIGGTSNAAGGIKIGGWDSTSGGIWAAGVTPTQSNHMLRGDGNGTLLNTPSGTALIFSVAGTSMWYIAPNGHFVANSDNTYDIGASGATRPRAGYFGTSLTVGGTGAVVLTNPGADAMSLRFQGNNTGFGLKSGGSINTYVNNAITAVFGATNGTDPAYFILPGNGAASVSGELLSGTWFTGGTSTTTKPSLLIEPTGTTSTGWSTSGTGLGVNAAAAFAGMLIDAQIAGVSTFNAQNGWVALNNTTVGAGPSARFDLNSNQSTSANDKNWRFLTNGTANGSFEFQYSINAHDWNGGGTSVITALRTGFVGIGTTGPNYKLDVIGSADGAASSLRIGNATYDSRLRIEGTQPYMIGMKNGAANNYIWMGATTGGGYQFSDQGGTALVTFSSTGVVNLTNNLLWTTDNTYDIGASGATRPRDFFLGRNATIGGTLAVTGVTAIGGSADANWKLKVISSDAVNGLLVAGTSKGVRFYSSASTYTIEGSDNTGAGSVQPLQISGTSLAFALSGTNKWQIDTGANFIATTDNTYDIGASGATRPRTGYFGTKVIAPLIESTGTVRLKGYTVATLPAGTQGDTVYATDLLTPTYLVAAVGGGAVVGPVFYNGAAWVSY